MNLNERMKLSYYTRKFPKLGRIKLSEATGIGKKKCEMFLRQVKNYGYRVLVIGDTHSPFMRDDYVDFLLETAEEYCLDTVVHVGDLVDNHAISYHESDPDGMSSGLEVSETRKQVAQIVKAFPYSTILVGNHDLIPSRLMKTHGLSRHYIKRFEEMWNLPDTWDVLDEYVLQNTLYQHGTNSGGMYGHKLTSIKIGMNFVRGHNHTVSGVEYHYQQGTDKIIFGMSVGCGIDSKQYAFAYAKGQSVKPVISCGVVEYGTRAKVVPLIK